MRTKLGYRDDDPLRGLRERLRKYLDSFEGQDNAPKLRGTSRIWNGRFGWQFGMLVVMVSGLTAWGYLEHQQDVETERLRLERLGIEQAAAVAIAARQAAELRKHQQPMPPSGIYSSYGPRTVRRSEALPPFKIVTNPGASYFLKLNDWSSGRAVLSIFIRGGEELEVGVPPGIYRIKLASGATWYGEEIRFGPNTEYTAIDKPTEFSIEGSQLLGHEIRLVNVRDGNLRRQPISATEF
jgi:hypothetical protein